VNNGPTLSSKPANGLAPVPFEVPERTARLLNLNVGLNSFSVNHSYDYRDQLRALTNAKGHGFLDAIPALADKAAAALAPIDRQTLLDRLTMLGMSMPNGKSNEQVTAWMHETARLLSDLPQGVLFDAIDECVKEPGRTFCPSVGEIREKAAKDLHRKEAHAARLRILANLIAEGVEIPEWVQPTRMGMNGPEPVPTEAETQCTPEQAAAILKEFGLPTSYGEKLAGFLKPEPPMSRADMIATGKVPPPIKPDAPDTHTMPC
jgi:hypothetical protein